MVSRFNIVSTHGYACLDDLIQLFCGKSTIRTSWMVLKFLHETVFSFDCFVFNALRTSRHFQFIWVNAVLYLLHSGLTVLFTIKNCLHKQSQIILPRD